MKYLIRDWACNTMFDGKEFDSFEDADLFLNQFICNTYPDTVDNDDRYSEEYGEYFIEELTNG